MKVLRATMQQIRRLWREQHGYVMRPENSSCPPTLHSRPYSGPGPLLGSVTFNRPLNLAISDQDSGPLQFPAKMLILASVGPEEGNLSDSIFVHFKTLGKQYGTVVGVDTTITPTGTEPWFDFRYGASAAGAVDHDLSYIKMTDNALFREFWVDIGSEGGIGTGAYTFIYTNDIEEIRIQPRTAS